MVRPSPGSPPLPAGCPWFLPSLSVLVGWCRLAGLVHTVPLSLAGELEGYLTTELLPTGPPALAAWWIVHPRALSESSSDSEGPKTGCLEHLVPGSLRGGFGWQPALACGWPPFTQVTGLLAAFLAAGVDWRLSWFRMILDPRMIRMIICSWSSLEPGADLGVGSWSSVGLLLSLLSYLGLSQPTPPAAGESHSVVWRRR